MSVGSENSMSNEAEKRKMLHLKTDHVKIQWSDKENAI